MNERSEVKTEKRPRRFLRVLLGLALVAVVVLVAGYFVVTSSSFLKGTILPRVSKELNAEITVSDASIHPFSSVTLKDLKVTPNGRETLVTAAELKARYGLWDILRGKILVEEVSVVSPTVHIVERADGTSNLDPILNKESTDEDDDDEKSKEESGEPARLDIRKVILSNATVRQEKQRADGQRELAEITGLNFTLSNLKNGDSGKVSISANVAVNNPPEESSAGGVLNATVNGDYVFALSSDLSPLSLKGDLRLDVKRAEGAFAAFDTFNAVFGSDIAPTEIKQLSLVFRKAQEQLGELRVSGPVNLEKVEGTLNVELASIDRRLLNLVGAAEGIDFGTTAINSTNTIQLANEGKKISVNGRFAADRLQVIQTNQSTPTLDLSADYDVLVDSDAGNAVIRTLTLKGLRDGRQFLRGELSSPMNISLGGEGESLGDSSFNLTLDSLDLADWKAFTGGITEGRVKATVALLSRQGGKQLQLKAASQLSNIAPIAGDKKLASALIETDMAVDLGGSEQQTIKGGIQLSNLVVSDPSGSIPPKPLELKLAIDTTLATNFVELRQLLLSLTPTERARNELLLAGRIDSSNPDAITGNLKLSSDGLDLTAYYDLVGANTNNATGSAASEGSGEGTTSEPQTDSSAVTTLPFRNFKAEAQIAKFYLREIAASNLVAAIHLDGGRVQLKPFEMTLNGAPMTADADIDLSVPGYKYALAFKLDQVPFAPLVNTFAPERKGELGGTLFADGQIKGVGTDGASLQKTLDGHFQFGTTNLNLSASNIRSPILKLIVSTIAMVPQLAQNPSAGLGSLIGGVTGSLTRGMVGGLSGDMTNSPIDVIAMRGVAGNGAVEIQEATVRSTVFRADVKGTVTLAPVLTNSSINFPVSVALVRPVAERIRMVPANTPTNATYVALPDFFSMGGTVGNPTPKYDAKALAGSVLQQVGGLIPGASATNSPVGNVIQGLGTLLGGNRSAAQTNQNQSVPPSGTISSPAPDGANTNAPAPTNSSPLGDILRQLGPKAK